MLKPTVGMRVFLAVSLIFIGVPSGQAAAATVDKKSVVPFCAAKNLSERSVVLPSASEELAGEGWFGISLIFTNHGTTACSLSAPMVQPVVGPKHKPVGREALQGPMPGWKGLSAVLSARNGTANVRYSMRIPTPNYPVTKGCMPQDTDGVVITFRTSTKVLLSAYFRIAKNQVCTRFQSTSIGGAAPHPLGEPKLNAALGCTVVWISDSDLWPEYQGQTVDAALQASAAGFLKFGPVVFEKSTGQVWLPGEVGTDNPWWYLVFTKDGHKGLGVVHADMAPDGFAYARLAMYCK